MHHYVIIGIFAIVAHFHLETLCFLGLMQAKIYDEQEKLKELLKMNKQTKPTEPKGLC